MGGRGPSVHNIHLYHFLFIVGKTLRPAHIQGGEDLSFTVFVPREGRNVLKKIADVIKNHHSQNREVSARSSPWLWSDPVCLGIASFPKLQQHSLRIREFALAVLHAT